MVPVGRDIAKSGGAMLPLILPVVLPLLPGALPCGHGMLGVSALP